MHKPDPKLKHTRASMRDAYGEALLEYGTINPNMVVLDADISSSTRTSNFGNRFPKRFFNLGIAEAGMVDVAVGLALGGKVPFVNTFASLLTLRAAEQVRTCVAYARTNVKLMGHHAGLSDSFDGPTHHSVFDLSVMRSMPNMTVIVPTDSVEMRKMVLLVAEYDGPVYMRINREEVPILSDERHEVEIGKGVRLLDGDDITIIGTGIMVSRCLEAAEELAARGISARVLEIHTLKPLDDQMVMAAAQETGALVTAEEHSIIGGLGGAVAELTTARYPVPLERVGIGDTFAESGPYPDLLDRYGMGVTNIVEKAASALSRKR